MIILFPKQVGCLLTQNHLDSKAVSCSKFKIARKPEVKKHPHELLLRLNTPGWNLYNAFGSYLQLVSYKIEIMSDRLSMSRT